MHSHSSVWDKHRTFSTLTRFWRTFSTLAIESFHDYGRLFYPLTLILFHDYKRSHTVAISIACSEKKQFPSLARKKSEGKGNISDFFRGFFQRSLGKIQRSLGKNLGTVAISFSALSEM